MSTITTVTQQQQSRAPVIVSRDPGDTGNTLGRLFCLTLFTPIRRQWRPILAGAFWLAKWLDFAQRHILQFNFIHFVRWTIVKDLPYLGPPQERDRLNYGYLFFESNFDGPWQHYIDAFAYCIPKDIRFVWGRGVAFPGPPPAEPLKRWIAMNSMDGGTYYAAYPEASTRMVKSAFQVRAAFQELMAGAGSLPPDQFKARYEQFLTRIQGHL